MGGELGGQVNWINGAFGSGESTLAAGAASEGRHRARRCSPSVAPRRTRRCSHHRSQTVPRRPAPRRSLANGTSVGGVDGHSGRTICGRSRPVLSGVLGTAGDGCFVLAAFRACAVIGRLARRPLSGRRPPAEQGGQERPGVQRHKAHARPFPGPRPVPARFARRPGTGAVPGRGRGGSAGSGEPAARMAGQAEPRHGRDGGEDAAAERPPPPAGRPGEPALDALGRLRRRTDGGRRRPCGAASRPGWSPG